METHKISKKNYKITKTKKKTPIVYTLNHWITLKQHFKRISTFMTNTEVEIKHPHFSLPPHQSQEILFNIKNQKK